MDFVGDIISTSRPSTGARIVQLAAVLIVVAGVYGHVNKLVR